MFSISKKSVISGVLALFTIALMPACGGGGSSSGGGSNNNPPPPQGTQVSITFAGSAPTVVAEQIGTGSWASASLSGGVLSLTIPQGTSIYGIAYLCPQYQGMGPIIPENILYATTSDPTIYTLTCFTFPATGTVTGNVNVSAIATATNADVFGGFGQSQFLSGTSGVFSFAVPTGTNDIAAVALDSSNDVVGVKFARSQTSPGSVNNGSAITLASTDATTTQTIVITNEPTGFTSSPAVSAQYVTSNGTFFGLSNSTGTQYAVVPSSEAQSTDYYIFSANNSSQVQIGQNIGVTQSVAAVPVPTTVSLAFPQPLPYVAPTPAALPTFTLNYTGFSGQTFVSYIGNIQWFTGGSTDNDVTVTATAAYQNGATTLSIPDLSAVFGFLTPPASGTAVDWFAYVYGGTYASYSQTPASGNVSWLQNEGQFTTP